MVQAPARDQRLGLDQRLDDRIVGVPLVALIVDDALALEARRFPGEAPVAVDGEGDRGVDAAPLQLRRVLHPDVKILAAVAWGGMHEARAVLIGDVVTGEEGDPELIAYPPQRMHAFQLGEICPRYVANTSVAVGWYLGGLENRRRKPVGQNVAIGRPCPVAFR